MKKTIEITEEQAKQMYESGIESLVSIAESTYPDLFHQEKKWEDFGNISGWWVNTYSSLIKEESLYTDDHDRNIYPTEEYAEAFGRMLPQLMQWYFQAVGEWRPKIGNSLPHIVCDHQEKILRLEYTEHKGGFTFVFHNTKQAEQFMKDHKTLLAKFYTLIKL